MYFISSQVVALRRQQYSRSISAQDIMQRKERPKTAPMNIYKENGPAAKKACLRRRKSSVFSSDSAKTKWRNMDRLVCVYIYVCTCMCEVIEHSV